VNRILSAEPNIVFFSFFFVPFFPFLFVFFPGRYPHIDRRTLTRTQCYMVGCVGHQPPSPSLFFFLIPFFFFFPCALAAHLGRQPRDIRGDVHIFLFPPLCYLFLFFLFSFFLLFSAPGPDGRGAALTWSHKQTGRQSCVRPVFPFFFSAFSSPPSVLDLNKRDEVHRFQIDQGCPPPQLCGMSVIVSISCLLFSLFFFFFPFPPTALSSSLKSRSQ